MSPISEAKKRANAKWDAANRTQIAATVNKSFAEELKSKAAAEGTTVSAILLAAAREFMNPPYPPELIAKAAELGIPPKVLHDAIINEWIEQNA